MRILLVRHGYAGPRKKWEGDDLLRPLTHRGKRQAQQVAQELRRYRPQIVISSPYLRCRQTVEVFSERAGMDVGLDDELVPTGGVKAVNLVDSIVRSGVIEARRSLVVCTHGEVIADLAELLPVEGMRSGRNQITMAKGSVWVIDFDGFDYKAKKYLPPAR